MCCTRHNATGVWQRPGHTRVRHPQYSGLMLIMVGFLLQWPTIPTLGLFPFMVLLYRRLAISEEREVAREFPQQWPAYAARTPRFVPRLRGGLVPGSTA